MTVETILLSVAAFIVGALGVGRLSRALYYDAFPPTAWLRRQWDKLTEDSDWNLLFHCPWCITHWVAGFAVLWYIIGLFWWPALIAWWIWHGWFALSYVASMIIVRDEPADEHADE